MDSRILEGYKRFCENDFNANRDLYEQLATQGQTPHTMVIACSDSRVQVDKILNANPGDLFVVRNVAAMVPPCEIDTGYHGTSAAIEFAVTALKVDNIAVIGHAGCGGVASVVDSAIDDHTFIGHWMEPLRDWLAENDDLIAKDPASRKSMLERAAVYLSIRNLKTFPFVQEALANNAINLEGMLFNIKEGDLSRVDAADDGAYRLTSLKNIEA